MDELAAAITADARARRWIFATMSVALFLSSLAEITRPVVPS